MRLYRQRCGVHGNVVSECDPKEAHVLNIKYGPNSAKQMWSTFGKNVAQSTNANQGVTKCGPHMFQQMGPMCIKTFMGQF